jgi:hypothetical protein
MHHAQQLRAHADAVKLDCAQPELAGIAKALLQERADQVASYTFATEFLIVKALQAKQVAGALLDMAIDMAEMAD